MFEDSLVESRVSHVSANTRWTAFASITVQCAFAVLVIALPLLHPEALPFHVDAPRVLIPLPPKPPVPIVRVQAAAASSGSSSMTTHVAAQTTLLPMLPQNPSIAAEDAPSMNPIHLGDVTSDAISRALGLGDGHASRVSVTPTRPIGPLRISSGMSQGMLLTPIRPRYPMIAKAAGVQGTVVVEAIISQMGTIESLRVVSGPPMLQAAAVEAIRSARYQPYRLNGEVIAVQTTFTIHFRMGG